MIKKKLTENLMLKFLAVVIATVLWLVVTNINDPVEELKFYNIPVELINTDAITGEGKVYEVLDNTDVINVTVSAKRSILGNIDKDSIRAVADLSQVSVTNMVTIKLSSNKSSNQIERIVSATEFLRLNIEDVKRKQITIDVTTSGDPAQGYIIGDVTAGQTVVRISGPDSVIGRIQRVQANVDVSGMQSNISTSADLVMYDVNGNIIRNKNIETNISTVDVNVTILATKQVPFKYYTTGTPAEGCEMSGDITGSLETVTIAGEQSVLDKITSIEIPGEALDVTGRADSLRVAVKVEDYLPEGVILSDENYSGSMTVTVDIRKLETRYISIPAQQISIINVPEGYKASLYNYNSNSTIGVRAIRPVLDRINEMTLRGVVDLKAYFEANGSHPDEDTYSIEAVFTMPDRVTQVHSLYVIVELEKIAEEQN